MVTKIFIFILYLFIFTYQIDPPVWPQTFTQSFIIGNGGNVFSAGKFWYDSKNNRQRTDLQNSGYDLLCSTILEDVDTLCSQVYKNGTVYVNFPQKGLCCRCCNQTQGCAIKQRDWLKDFNFTG